MERLVGSEMCIRDRPWIFHVRANTIKTQSIDNWTLKAGKINGAVIPKTNIAVYKIIFLFIIFNII